MALNHIHMNISVKSRKTHSNGKITSAIGSAAYRHKNAFTDDLGRKFDYSHRNDELVKSFLIVPPEITESMKNHKTNPFARAIIKTVQDKTLSMQERKSEISNHFWQWVDKTEKRKDAQLFREVELSLYHNLTLEENEKVLQEFVKRNFTSKGMIADICIHDSGGKGSNQNLHAHIMLTMRDFDTENCTFGKKNRDWNNPKLAEEWRESWTEISNKALENANQNRVEYKSFRRLAREALNNGNYELVDLYLECDKNKAIHINRCTAEMDYYTQQNQKAQKWIQESQIKKNCPFAQQTND